MTAEIGVLFAVGTMLSWELADFFAKEAIDKTGYKTSLVINQAVSFIPLFIFAALFFRLPSFTPDLVLIILLTGIFSIVGHIFLYRGFQNGDVSVVSPLSFSWAIITTLLAVFLFNEALTPIQIVGIAVVFVGIFLASTNLAELRKSVKHWRHNGVMDGIVCMVAWGITYGPNQTHCIRCRSNHGAFLFQGGCNFNFAFLDWIYKNKNFFSSKINFSDNSRCWLAGFSRVFSF